MIEASLEQRGRRAVVLGRAEHDDRVRAVDLAGVVVVRGAPHDDGGGRDRGENEEEADGEDREDRVPANQAHRARLTAWLGAPARAYVSPRRWT